jgi:hypothetical protein
VVFTDSYFGLSAQLKTGAALTVFCLLSDLMQKILWFFTLGKPQPSAGFKAGSENV